MFRLATQCRDAVSGKTGCFLYNDELIAKVAATEIFPDLHSFFQWAHKNNLEQYQPEGESYNPYLGAWRVRGLSQCA